LGVATLSLSKQPEDLGEGEALPKTFSPVISLSRTVPRGESALVCGIERLLGILSRLPFLLLPIGGSAKRAGHPGRG
jgi:hypothetical protein